MNKEELIAKELTDSFKELIEGIRVERRRVWVELKNENVLDVMKYIKSKGYYHLSTITGFDEGETLGAIYHITDHKTIVNLRIRTPKTNPVIKSVLSVYPVATSYEKELQDLFGIKVDGLGEGRRYPLPDDFPQGVYPLRKDVKLDELNKMLNKQCSKEE